MNSRRSTSSPLSDAFARHDDEVRGKLAAATRALPGAQGAVCHALHGSAAHVLLRATGEAAADAVGAPAGAPRPLDRLLLTTDLSELSAAAHERGLDLADDALFGGASAERSMLVVGLGALSAPLPEAALARTARAELRRFLRVHTP
jgi:hypothetical protein